MKLRIPVIVTTHSGNCEGTPVLYHFWITRPALHYATADDVHLYNLTSYQTLVELGVSKDKNLRVFELSSNGQELTIRAENPLF